MMRLPFLLSVLMLAGCAEKGVITMPSGGGDTVGTSAMPNPACKRGMASGSGVTPALSAADMQALVPGISWWYTWGATPDNANVAAEAARLGVQFVPMLFRGPVDANALITTLPNDGNYLLAFNEPNFTAQGNLTPAQAAALWPNVEAVARAKGLKIVSPALNYCGGGCNETDPFTWLDEFFAQCANCQVDAVAVHSYVCYDSALSSAYLQPFEQRYGKPIWLTEFACLDGSADGSVLANQENLMKSAVADMEADPNVQRYAWFLARSSTASPPISLLGASGELTPLGQQYVSLPQTCEAP